MSEQWNVNDTENERQAGGWERELLTELATSSLKERKSARRWGIFFKLLAFAYLIALLGMLSFDTLTEAQLEGGPHTALIDITGVIADGGDVDADDISKALRKAFKDENTKGVMLRINSPGGSPVQSSYIYKEIRRLREKYPKIPLYAVVSDVCASGGYYIASAADKIYVNQSSIVGSIGVIMSSFGFVGTMDKLGVERRLQTAGEHKAILDPFSPRSEFDTQHMQTMLNQIHEHFIQAVKDGRGDRLADNPDIFSGLFWTGAESVKLGLADDMASPGQVAREIIKEEKIVDFTPQENLLDKLTARLGTSMAKSLAEVTGLVRSPEPR